MTRQQLLAEAERRARENAPAGTSEDVVQQMVNTQKRLVEDEISRVAFTAKRIRETRVRRTG